MSTVDKVLDVTLSYIQENDWCGACYATAAINHILLNELEIQSELCIGVFKAEITNIEGVSPCYDHAWVEIDENIYDVAITKGLNINFGDEYLPAAGVRGECSKYFRYGINMNLDHEVGEMVHPLSKFMQTTPCFDSSIDYWDIVEILGSRIGLNLKKEELVSRYEDFEWTLVSGR
ncbi:hypothetical protein [Enterovibrio sp. FF113]|uniref:hypothetical protein n=1 Tax=Enterovibrio sp. FF113 TaxID=3230010 RepID=UPI00352C13A8